MKNTMRKTALILLAGIAVLLSIWGPEALAKYKDKGILNEAHFELIEDSGQGYRYQLNANDKLYILSCSLINQTLPQTEQNALATEGIGVEYQDLEGSYAFVVNHRGPSGKEITDKQIYETCSSGVENLKTLGILPKEIRKVEAASYDATLYSAIDVLDPRNNVAVWKVSLSNSQNNANKENRLIDAYIDADNGKLYEFYVRTPLLWEDINADAIVKAWADYMGLDAPQPYESVNPLLETTPFFKKYVFSGMGSETTIVTVGFYEGINELFLKIS
ncbi:MAG: hypothetical protein HFJ08_07180 [Lachnospiraceae bacterium]|nr:hypothetical protein [Lachnospiraceae bacterium]MCI9399985.1 hypothetical protein [Lachnospiraceae bacterium]MCX4375175.1 hypothetical protein [Lachnospiraceae bacterium]